MPRKQLRAATIFCKDHHRYVTATYPLPNAHHTPEEIIAREYAAAQTGHQRRPAPRER